VSALYELPVLDPAAVPAGLPEAPSARTSAPAGPTPEEIVAQAHAEADAIRAQAREDGFAAGLQAAQAEVATTTEALASALASVAELRGQVADEVERGAVALGLRIAEQALGGALAAQPERVLDVVRGALRAVVERERLVIQVNPEDLEIVREGLDELRASLGGIEHIDVQEERRVQRGGAVIRTEVGEIDANIRTKLDRAHEAVVKELRA
jgi:flagellar assembly protein FliH